MAWLCILFLPTFSSAGSVGSNWQGWLQNQVVQHPEVIAAKRKMDAVLALAEGNQRPLYNPELETEYERNGDDNNYSIGVNQTLDFWGKRGVRISQSGSMQLAAQMHYRVVVQDKKSQSLQAIVDYQASRHLAGFAEQQEAQMNTLLQVVEKRRQAGDMGQADTELAFLNLTQRLAATANARVTLRQLELQLTELLPEWSPETIQIPARFWELKGHALTSQELDLLPVVAAAKAEYELVNQQARLAKLAGRPDPTLGISAGEDGEENVVALTFSVPLHFRNNYQAEANAATLESASAKQNYMAVKRQYHFASQASLARMEEYRNHYERWQTLMQGRSEASGKLIAQQWESGDLSTTEYLLALDQVTAGMMAEIELRTEFQRACVNWLLVSGQLDGERGQYEN
jgi:outer membrane protein TolC